MAYYVVAGRPDCKDFVHVLYVCDYLDSHLPLFSYRKIESPKLEWDDYLCDINRKNGWHHLKSPLIWKEVAKRGGKPSYIGGVSEFWEYVYNYYGLESALPKEDVERLVKDNVQFYDCKLQKEADLLKNIMKVTVSGIRNPMIRLILPAIADMPNLRTSQKNQLMIRYYDMDVDLDDANYDFIENVMEATTDMIDKVQLITTLQQALDDCDLYIELADYSRKIGEPAEVWLTRNMAQMSTLGDAINSYAKRDLKVLLAHPGPCCFNATLLVEYCTGIRPTNIIAVCADRGAIPLSIISRELKIPLTELSAPPVWGLWLRPFVDVGAIVKRSDIHRPYLRAIRTNGGSTLPLGRITPELKYINYMVDGIWDLWEKVDAVKDVTLRVLKRPPTYAKAMATIKVIQLWHTGKPSNEIISLGICSNGCFGFPPGVVVSQPAVFDGKDWVPFKNFPIPEYTRLQIEDLSKNIEEMFVNYNFKVNYIKTKSRVIL